MVQKTNRELRKFGLTLAIGFVVLGCILLWKEKSAGHYTMGAVAALVLISLIRPGILAPVEWLWMKIAHALGSVMTYILLTLTFYLMITPIGLVMKIIGKDPLNRKFDKDTQTYWVKRELNGPASGSDKPY